MNGNGKWLSKAAVLWALDEAPDVPDRLVSTLIVVARYASEDGRGAHPSAPTVALGTRKSIRQAQRDLAELESLGLLVRGDQRLVKDIRADKRPVVYDLPMPRHDTDDVSSRHDTHDVSSANGTTPRVERHDTSPLSGTTMVSYKEVLKTSGKRATGDGAGAPRSLAQSKPAVCAYCRSRDHKHCVAAEIYNVADASKICICWCCTNSPCEMCAGGEHGCCADRDRCACIACAESTTAACDQRDGLDCADCKGLMPDGETWCMDWCHTAYRESVGYRIAGHPPGGSGNGFDYFSKPAPVT